MKNTLFKINNEVAEKINQHFATMDFQTLVSELKTVGKDTGTFRMVISTDNIDRHGEVVVQDGWQLENYMKNPVVLWGHEHYSIPVGITDKLSIETAGGYKALVAEGRFASHEFAQTLRKLYDEKMLQTSSVGFIPMEYNGNQITKAELLEWSFVSIPANPFAVDARGFDVAMLKEKGIIKDIEDIKEGDDIENENDDTDDEPNEEQLDEASSGILGDEELSIELTDGSIKKFKLTKEFALKSGRVISKANLEKITNAKEALEAVITLASSEQDEEKSDNVSEGLKDADVQEAEDFLTLRKGVQGIATALGDLLSHAKKVASEYQDVR